MDEILQCTKCNSQLKNENQMVFRCKKCRNEVPIINKVPVFIENPHSVNIVSPEHISNQIPEEIIKLINDCEGMVLNLGAGGTLTKAANTIELEYSIFKNTDIVGDAHCLPFRDETFSMVVCFNVFEHLRAPNIAAKEIYRVLKPGGKVFLQTAFLQPLHEGPVHFYGATKYGLLKWFEDFEIDDCYVSNNFNPIYTLSWISAEILNALRKFVTEEEHSYLSNLSIHELSGFWIKRGKGYDYIQQLFEKLDQESQTITAAGFQLNAKKPQNPPISNEVKSTATLKEQIDGLRQKIIERLECSLQFQKLGGQPWMKWTNHSYDTQIQKKDISIIISSYNYSNYIGEAIQSIFNSNISSIPNGIELIIVDDHSTDSTVNMVKELSASSHIPVLLVEKLFNTGVADTRNIGIKLSSAEFIFNLDADNIVSPNGLEKLFSAIKDSKYSAVYSSLQIFKNDISENFGLISHGSWDLAQLVSRPYIDAMAMFRKSDLELVDYYSTELIYYGWFGWEDYDLWLKLGQRNCECLWIQETLGFYRDHPVSMIKKTNHYSIELSSYFCQKFKSLHRKYNNSTETIFGSSIEKVELLKEEDTPVQSKRKGIKRFTHK